MSSYKKNPTNESDIEEIIGETHAGRVAISTGDDEVVEGEDVGTLFIHRTKIIFPSWSRDRDRDRCRL